MTLASLCAYSLRVVLLTCATALVGGCGGGGATGNSGSSSSSTSNQTNKQWVWVGGSDSYNTQTTASIPGGRADSVTWTDGSGNLWLFGGGLSQSLSSSLLFNDLWELNPTSKNWTRISGDDSNSSGSYGTKGNSSTSNIPGSREGGVGWIDGNGNMWLFGGYGWAPNDFGSSGQGDLNDLWEFNPASSTWTWVSGSSTVGQNGIYGTEGTASPSNIPGSREGGVSWIDGNGNMWLFGGYGSDSGNTSGYLNDLWEFNTASSTWTWVSGSSTAGQNGIYGTQGTASPSNIPGARAGAVSWIDKSGSFWVFGGNDGQGNLNDLWKFNPASITWTWVNGSSTVGQKGIYGTQGAASPSNIPGARAGGVGWIDGNGNMWLFGGYGWDSENKNGYLNDLWEFNPASSTWTWVTGSSTAGQDGIYGTQGTASPSNIPGAREGAAVWMDHNGHPWLFGGYGFDPNANPNVQEGFFNDLWRYNP